MVFNSSVFLIFFLVFYTLYWKISSKYSLQIRNIFILMASYVFYGWWDWKFLGLILASSFIDFFIGQKLYKAEKPKQRKFLLGISILSNLGILFFFKYFNFFIESLHWSLSNLSISVNLTTLEIILPVGISFYTFQTLSYTIDIYRKTLKPTSNLIQFLAFVSFFPQLVAGPIERASHLLPQFNKTYTFSYKTAISGLRLVLWGFFKKLVIADNFGALTDLIFANQDGVSGLSVLVGTLCFALQIYADFSGYSDMAIGFSRMLGFDLMKNFKTPYFSKSFGEFWRRWHISLSTWFRDYVYIPLGGNKVGPYRIYSNLFITFLVSGLWHGASFNFIIWGALHGCALMLEKRIKIKSIFYRPIALSLILMFWLPFRANTFHQLLQYTKALFNTDTYNTLELYNYISTFSTSRFYALLGVTFGFLTIEYFMQHMDANEWLNKQNKTFRYTFYYTLVLTILLIGNFSVKPNFIYFQF